MKLLLEMDTALKGDVLIDVMRFRQIVTNLLGNAIKFTDHGQVMLRAQPQWQNGEFMLLELTIADTGEGLISRRNSVCSSLLVRVRAVPGRRAVGWGFISAASSRT